MKVTISVKNLHDSFQAAGQIVGMNLQQMMARRHSIGNQDGQKLPKQIVLVPNTRNDANIRWGEISFRMERDTTSSSIRRQHIVTVADVK